MSDESNPLWIRLLDDAIGLIVIVVALVAVLELAFSFAYALEVLSLGILAMGIAWIAWGVFLVRTKIYARIFMLATGVTAIAISLFDFIYFSLSPDLLIIYPAIAMLLVGVSRLALGFLIGGVPLWVQMLQVLAGILTINLAAFVFIFSNINLPAMIILLIISLVANGLVRLIVGRTDVHQQYLQPAGSSVPSDEVD
ncbi:MAG: hypothetical protein BV458_09115 [Thermoplasmata archaeon M9B2D]|nr:MAG: hypothetical protein BV458_09115 [Thermoplasmata archaeon M9B2D]